MDRHTFAWLRAGAEMVECPDCPAIADMPCINLATKQPLHKRPAHERRLLLAERAGIVTIPPAPPHPDDLP